MRKTIIAAILIFTSASVGAQSVRKEISENLHLSASNHLAYPNPKPGAMTAPPDGKKPFYISHYGRHGSRFLIGKDEYDAPYSTLAKADSAGALTDTGRDVMRRIAALRDEARGRLGELTRSARDSTGT